MVCALPVPCHATFPLPLTITSTSAGRERVLVLGSGWAGYTVARHLDRKLYQTIVVSPRSYFVFTPLLASTSVGTLEFRNVLEPVRSRYTKAEFIQGWADGVDFENKKLQVEEAVEETEPGMGTGANERSMDEIERMRKGNVIDVEWDKLVVAVGCYNQTFGTPGVRENALFLKDVGDARRIRQRILACFETASLPTTSEEMKKCLLNFAIVGGGREFLRLGSQS